MKARRVGSASSLRLFISRIGVRDAAGRKFRVEYFVDDAERSVYIAEIFQRSGRSDYK